MTLRRHEKLFAIILLTIFGGIVIHAPLSVGFGVMFPDYALLAKIWKEILLVIATTLAVVIVTRRKMWQQLFSDVVIRLITVFALVHFAIVAAVFHGVAATAAGLAIDLRYLLFFGLVYLLLKIAPHYKRLMLKVGVIGACVVVGFAALQLFLPPDILKYIGYSKDTIEPFMTIDQNSDFIRVNSTLRGPNPLGAYAVIVLSILAAAVAKRRLIYNNAKVVIFGICSTAALWLSYSRSAFAAMIVSWALMCAVVLRMSWQRVAVTVSAILLTVAVSVIAIQGNTFIDTVVFHDDSATGAAITSNQQHLDSLQTGINRLITSPLGEGVGSAGSASLYGGQPSTVESQYLFVAHEVGIVGLALFVCIYGIVLSRLWKKRSDWLALGVFASGVGLGVIGLFLPVWADDTVAIVWWGLAAIVIGGRGGRKQTK